MNEEVLELGGMNINDLAIIFKDLSARELIQEIINAITLNNSAIGSRINDLNNRLSEVELNYVSKSVIGNLPNKIEAQSAIYYTQDEADAYNTEHNLEPEDEGYVTTETIMVPAVTAVPYSSVSEAINDHFEILSTAIIDRTNDSSSSIDPSLLSNYVTKTELANVIGNLGNKVEAAEATYYTAEDDEVIAGTKQVGDIKTAAIPAVPYTNVAEVIEDNEEIWSAAMADLNSKYESLNS